MTARKLITPFGYFEVLHNGRNIYFSVEEGINNLYYTDDGIPAHADGCYTVRVETIRMNPRDVITARFSQSGLRYDGGDEYTINAVAKSDFYTFGIGCCDTVLLEEYRKTKAAKGGYSTTSYMFPFEFIGISEETDGFEFRMIDDPEKYLCYKDSRYYPDRTVISLPVAWNKNTDEYAWDIVSFLTG